MKKVSGIVVNGEMMMRAQIRKEIVNDMEDSDSFGPWILAKRNKSKHGKTRFGKSQVRGNQGVKEGNLVHIILMSGNIHWQLRWELIPGLMLFMGWRK